MTLYPRLRNLLDNIERQELIEYALVALLTAIVIILTRPGVAPEIASIFDSIATCVSGG